MENPSNVKDPVLVDDRKALEAMFRDDTKGLEPYSPEDAAAFRELESELVDKESASVTPYETKSKGGTTNIRVASSIGESALAVHAGSWQNPNDK